MLILCLSYFITTVKLAKKNSIVYVLAINFLPTKVSVKSIRSRYEKKNDNGNNSLGFILSLLRTDNVLLGEKMNRQHRNMSYNTNSTTII